jgi:hypothetical protein
MLRDVLMCTGDTGVITYHWVKKHTSPVPDFSTMVSYLYTVGGLGVLFLTLDSTTVATRRRFCNGPESMK